jgi:hypothetical protein
MNSSRDENFKKYRRKNQMAQNEKLKKLGFKDKIPWKAN